MIQRLSPALSRGDGDIQILPDPGLTDKIIKPPRTEASIKREVLSAWFTRYNTLYVTSPPYRLVYHGTAFQITSQ